MPISSLDGPRCRLLLAACWRCSTPRVAAQAEITDEQLEAVSRGRTVVIGSPNGERSVTRIPLEVYVARVLAGEGGAQRAGCRTSGACRRDPHLHPRADGTPSARGLRSVRYGPLPGVSRGQRQFRRAALATARRVLTVNGAPAEVFYSASCGGRSEGAAHSLAGRDLPLHAGVRDDDVHDEDAPWTLDLTLDELRQALTRAGFGGGSLRDITIDGYNASGRVERLRVPGMRPNEVRARVSRRRWAHEDSQHGVHASPAWKRRPIHAVADTGTVSACV